MEGKLCHTRHSRGLLVLVLAVVVALVATPAAQSAQGQPVIAGQFNDATSQTVLENGTLNGIGLLARSGGPSAVAVQAETTTGVGVWGSAGTGTGVRATTTSATKSALFAENLSTDPNSGGVAVEALNHAPTGAAIYGHHDPATTGYGVYGEAPIGVGVQGRGSVAGVHGFTDDAAGAGVIARNTAGGTALETLGGVKFSTAGIATVPSGQGQVTVAAGVDVTTNTKVLVTQMSGGKKFTFVERNFAADTLTFRLQRAATNNVILAYFVIS